MDRVDLTHQYGTDRQRAWRSAGSQSSALTVVVFGRLGDGRWFADRHGRGAAVEDSQLGACVFTTYERGRVLALRLAYSWMRDLGGRWWPMPAAFGPDRRPVDGLPWVLRGGEWLLDGVDAPGIP